MKEKYTTSYYLKKDEYGKDTVYGVEGLPEFEKGDIRSQDKDILNRIEFTGKNVLDIGFGRGEALKFAADHGAINLVGVDFSEAAYEIAKNFLNNNEVNAELYCEEAVEFLKSYLSNSGKKVFDIVLMLDCVEHIPRFELNQIFGLLSQCLSTRGIIVINTPAFKVDNDVITDGLDPQARDTGDDFEETAGMHCNRYTQKSLKFYMKNLGFKAISGHFFVPYLPILSFLEGRKQAWKKACKVGYPILLSAINNPEQFEYAMSWEEMKRLEGKKQRNIVAKINNLARRWKSSSI
jgi:2-polyprenyl-3-methyl-5-hydroxy-6-metoxy-1,4-benzoquinol methylase